MPEVSIEDVRRKLVSLLREAAEAAYSNNEHDLLSSVADGFEDGRLSLVVRHSPGERPARRYR